jgi:hypothetical protein
MQNAGASLEATRRLELCFIYLPEMHVRPQPLDQSDEFEPAAVHEHVHWLLAAGSLVWIGGVGAQPGRAVSGASSSERYKIHKPLLLVPPAASFLISTFASLRL